MIVYVKDVIERGLHHESFDDVQCDYCNKTKRQQGLMFQDDDGNTFCGDCESLRYDDVIDEYVLRSVSELD